MSIVNVVTIPLFEVSIHFDSIFEKNAISNKCEFFVTNVYKFLITAQHYNTGSA